MTVSVYPGVSWTTQEKVRAALTCISGCDLGVLAAILDDEDGTRYGTVAHAAAADWMEEHNLPRLWAQYVHS